ncbi:LOW QUALITY PROTEIN: hypothetical protein ACHAXT_005108 [Thalassiosira profunda]
MEPAAAASSASREDGAVAEAPGDPPGDPAPDPGDGSASLGQQGEMVQAAAEGQAGEQADAEDNGEGGAETRRAMIMEIIRHRRELLEYVRNCRLVAEEEKASRLLEMAAIAEEVGGDEEDMLAMIDGRFFSAKTLATRERTPESQPESMTAEDKRAMTIEMIRHRRELLECVRQCRIAAEEAVEEKKASDLSEMPGGDVEEMLARKRSKRKSEDGSDDAPPKKKARKDSTGGNWGKMFAILKTYKEEKGNCNVPKGYAQDKQLGTWVQTQRKHYKKWLEDQNHGQMTPERVQQLESIGFVWSPATQDSTGGNWGKMLANLKAYNAEKGDCNVPGGYPEDKQLGKWVDNQRQKYKLRNKGKPSSMTPERVLELEGIGFVWDVLEEQWNDNFARLQAYKEDNDGDCNVPSMYADDPQLGRWVGNQRQQYRLRNEGKPSHITDERVASLNSIGFDWVYKHPAHKRYVAIMQAFYESTNRQHCHIPHPSVTTSDELKSIWTFVCALRKRYRKGEPIPKWIFADLDAIGFEFDPPPRRDREDRVETKCMYDILMTYGTVPDTVDVTIDALSNCRPDATITSLRKNSHLVIDEEKDEHEHNGEPVWKEQMKMNDFSMRRRMQNMIASIFFGPIWRKEPDRRQQAKLNQLINIIRLKRFKGVHVWYLDYPEGHHHVSASWERRIGRPLSLERRADWNYELFDGIHCVSSEPP